MVNNTYYSLDKLYRMDAGMCWLCQMPCSLAEASRDHVIPASMGGAYSWKNLALAHEDCNHKRKDQFPAAPFRGMSIPVQRHAWARAKGRCEGCGYTESLVLFPQRPGTPHSAQIMCLWCSDRGRPRTPDAPLTLGAAGLLAPDQWKRLRASCNEAVPVVVSAAVVETSVGPVLQLEQPAPVEVEPHPLTPAPAAAPRFTPADMARQLAAAQAPERARLAAMRRTAELAGRWPAWIWWPWGELAWSWWIARSRPVERG